VTGVQTCALPISTTSNMGATVILPHYNSINLSVAKKLAQKMPECRIIGSPDPQRKYLASQSDLGMMIEVGPVANGMIEALALERTLKVLDIVLEELAQGIVTEAGEVELFEEIEDISYPLDEKGEITAYIHPELQGKDFAPLEGQFKAFKTFDGKEIFNGAKEELHPIFINEAAYYPQKLAFTLCRKTKVKIK